MHNNKLAAYIGRALNEALGDPDPRVRFDAARLMHDILELEGCLIHRQPSKLLNFRLALPGLVKAMDCKDPGLRLEIVSSIMEVAEVLRHTKHVREMVKIALDALIKAVEDPVNDIRVMALYAISALGPAAKRAKKVLHGTINDPDKTVRDAAQSALADICRKRKDSAGSKD